MEVLEWTSGMDIDLHDRVSVARAAKKWLAPRVAAGPRAARFDGFAGSVFGVAGVKSGEAFANPTRRIPAGCGPSIAADCVTARSLF